MGDVLILVGVFCTSGPPYVRDRNFLINRLIKNMADQLRLEESRRGGSEERRYVSRTWRESEAVL